MPELLNQIKGGIDAYTALMLHMDGVNGCTHILDSSTVAVKVMTAVGNAAIDDAQKKFGVSSLYLDGTGDYVTTPDHADWNLAAGDWTIDSWVRIDDLPADQKLMVLQSQQMGTAPYTSYAVFGISNIGGVYYWRIKVVSADVIIANVSVAATVAADTWYHLAILRSGNNWMIFQDGVQVGSTSVNSGTYPDLTGILYIGSQNTTYTSKTMTAVGHVQIDTAQSKFGGASGLFDGIDDYLSTPDSADWYFGTGDFTIDFWARFNALPTIGNLMTICSQRTSTPSYSEIEFYNNGGTYQVRYSHRPTTGAENISVAKNIDVSIATWYHFALVRSGNDWYWFKDGTQIGSPVVDADPVTDIASPFSIGAIENLGIRYLNGWLDEFRVSKGIARWTSAFTPPSSPYTTDAYTVLLLHCDGTDGSTTFIDGEGFIDFKGWLDEYRISKGIARWTANFTPPTIPYDVGYYYDLGLIGYNRWWKSMFNVGDLGL